MQSFDDVKDLPRKRLILVHSWLHEQLNHIMFVLGCTNNVALAGNECARSASIADCTNLHTESDHD